MVRTFFQRHNLLLLGVLLLTACGEGGGGSNTTADPTPGLSRIEITPSQPSLAKGSVLNLTATGIYSDNSTRTLNTEVAWISGDEGIATIASSGEITAANAGQVAIQASLDSIVGSTQLTVTNATLSRLELSPTSIQLAKGTRQSLALTGHYNDGSTQDVTEPASWAVADNAIASLSSPVISGDLWLTGLTVGSTTLDVTLGAVSAQVNVTITAASLVQLVISPESSTLPPGTTLNLSALGLYSDNSSQILTDQVSWSSTDTGILTIDESGLIAPQSVGSTTVTAALAGITASHTAVISDAVLATIEVSTTSDTIPLGNLQPLTALGHFSDGSLQNLTEQVVWQSTPGDLLAISNVSGSRGLATALASGAVTVTATLGDIAGSLELDVSAATLSSIDISPLNARLAAGTRTDFSAAGRYSDGSVQDISELVSWASTDTGFATISNVNDSRGQALAIAQGATTVSATLGNITASATLTVTAAQLLSINVVPPELTLPAGTHQTVHAEGNFSDGSVQNLDGTVTWESETPGVAAVNDGEISALVAGNSTRISANWQGIAANALVTVSDATLVNLQISPVDPALAIGTEAQLQATAIYSDGSQRDVTSQVTWSSADTTRLRAENSAGQQGRLVALASGNVTITASLGSVSTSVTVSVSGATLTGIRISPPVSTSLDSAEQLQLTVLGDFSDSSSQDISAAVIWSTDAPELASVSNNATDRGLVLAGINVSGIVVITASYGGSGASLSLTINDTPTRPVSLTVVATPNVINNNGIDASTVEIRVLAAAPGDNVDDGTAITLQISQAGTVLGSQTLVTTNGLASTSVTATETGLLQIEASIDGTTLSNQTVMYTSPTIYDVIAGAAFANILPSGNQILTGSRFGIFMFNLSNRTFPLLGYELRNGTDIVYSTSAAQDLNNNQLTGGLKIGAIYTTEQDLVNQGIEARFYLTDPATGDPITFRVPFTTAP